MSTSYRRILSILIAMAVGATACVDEPATAPEDLAGAPALVSTPKILEGREIFRFDDFGSWRFWTDELRLNDAVETLTPNDALGLGLKVDADMVPTEVLQAVANDPSLLDDPATTLLLLSRNAVVGINATVSGDQIERLGITCALCHSTVDDGVLDGVGSRLDGWPNLDLLVGPIVAAAPELDPALALEYKKWPAGFYDPRFNIDGINDPVVIPPAYGLRGVGLETYTGEGPISYWNNYVAVTQMHGHGSFSDPRLGISIAVPRSEDEVLPKLPELRVYQHSLETPSPPANSFDPAAAERGGEIFRTVANCSSCHAGPHFTSGNLHAPEATGMDPLHAERGTTRLYRATPLRALWQHPPYFHDGSATTLADVVEHYDSFLSLDLTVAQKEDLVEYLKSL